MIEGSVLLDGDKSGETQTVEMKYAYIQSWPRWRVLNLWRKFDLYDNPGWSFSVFNCWWNDQFCGLVLLNFGVEYNRKA